MNQKRTDLILGLACLLLLIAILLAAQTEKADASETIWEWDLP